MTWQGHPLGQAPLFFMDENSYFYWEQGRARLAQVTTDAEGYYRVDHLPEKLCYVFRENPDHQLGTVLDAVLPTRRDTMSV